MIEYFDCQKVKGSDFWDYRAWEYFSHSTLKREVNGVAPKMERTGKMEFGQMVDELITEPQNADLLSPHYREASKAAGSIRAEFGNVLKLMEGQVSFFGKAKYGNFVLPVKGRFDLWLDACFVLDLKWTDTKVKDIPKLVTFMGYRDQLWHYCRLAGVDRGYLLFWSHPDQRSYLIRFDFTGEHYNEFYAEKIRKFGKVA